MREPDLMLKYSTLLGLFVFLIILTIQTMNSAWVQPLAIYNGRVMKQINKIQNPKRSGWIYWSFIILSAIVLLTFIPITWFKKLWVLFMPVNEENSNLVNPPKSNVLLCLFNISRNIMQNAIARTCIYLATISLLMVCSLVHLTECVIEETGDKSTIVYSPCRNPWVSNRKNKCFFSAAVIEYNIVQMEKFKVRPRLWLIFSFQIFL